MANDAHSIIFSVGKKDILGGRFHHKLLVGNVVLAESRENSQTDDLFVCNSSLLRHR